MLLGHRRHRDHTASRKDDYRAWNTESDSDRQRQPTGTSHRYDIEYGASTGHDRDRHHRSSKRTDAMDTSAVATAPRPSSHRHASAAPAPPAASSSRARTQDNAQGAHDLQAYLQRRTDRRSPRSSEERVYAAEHGTTSRSIAQQSRTAHPTVSGAQTPSTSQANWIPSSQSIRELTPSLRHYHDRDRERDREKERETREQRRERKERERAALEEREWATSVSKHPDWSRDRPTTAESITDVERARDRAANKEKELERQRRREEKERRRAEREREKERERRKEEKEQERARRHRERERSAKEGRPREDSLQYYAVYPQITPTQTSIPNTKHRGDERSSGRRGPFLTDQVPSSSSNVALPYTVQSQQNAPTRPEGANESRKDEVLPTPIPPQVPEKDRKHRSHRERLLQQAGQESGLSSSEQEPSGKERKSHRTAERRRTTRELDTDAHPSGPSGSETERLQDKERRRMNQVTNDGFYSYPNRSKEGRQQSTAYGQASAPVPTAVQDTAPVGSIRSQHLAPQIVSIRAGQGPADPQTPLLHMKTSAPTTQPRPREQQAAATQVPTAPAQGRYSPQSYPVQSSSSRPAVPPTTPQDMPRIQGNQPYYRQTSTVPPHSQQQAPAQQPGTSLQAAPENGPTTHHTSAYPAQGAVGYQPRSSQNVPYVNGNVHATRHTTSQNPAGVVTDPPVQRTYVPPIPAKGLQPPPITKSRSGSSLKRVANAHLEATSASTAQPAAHLARLSVYRSPGPAISAELVVPVALNKSHRSSGGDPGKTPRAPAQDLSSRFPLHEDMLTSASSSTLAPGTGRSAANILPGYSQHYAADAINQGSSAHPAPVRPSSYTPLLENMPGAYGGNTPLKHSAQISRAENETPIPIPVPRVNGGPVQDAATLYQYSGQQQSQISRLATGTSQAKPPQVSSASAYATAHAQGARPVASRYTQQGAQEPSTMLTAPMATSGHSPHRKTSQQSLQRPSSVHLTPHLGPATPKHSPSARLGTRNGSTDTIQHTPVKNSPNDPYRSLAQRNSNGSLRTTQPSSRPDTKTTRTLQMSEYPDSARYRSTVPVPYPANASHQHGNYSANTTNQAHGPSTTHHSRSASQPTNQYDYQPSIQRNHTAMATSGAAPSPAAAPSASALAAAYRSGLYNAEHNTRSQESSSHRVPQRSAPSPAPSISGGRTYVAAPAPSLLSKSGFATTTTPGQPTRSQTHPVPLSRPPGAPTSASHSRTVSDPQFSRVAISGHPSTPAPKSQLAALPNPSEELLKTPSSIARSVSKGSQLPPPVARTSTQSIKSKDRDSRVKSILGFFRSRSSPPKEEGASPPSAAPPKPRQRSTSQTTFTAMAASVKNIVAPHPTATRSQAPRPPGPPAPEPPSTPTSRQDRRRHPERPEVLSPIPVQATAELSAQLGHGQQQKMFTPFRLLSKKHRAISEASVEAQDGTATNTMIGGESARSSTAGRPSPPLRDPMEATMTWRIREDQERMDKGTGRRRRRPPGVVFDLGEDSTDTEKARPIRISTRR
ncbi:hypothetical protein NM688_g3883 [Phlebia brevispora]|uniref:Uncharacterized protein n=1 Tax=Phlebia brevispora TaxID=194682 RepID=A0ACC1T4J5_9APHY|nr:hypothetical protein NM688_g3883 [Phlebia brevispora]